MTILEQLFSSTERIRLLRFALFHPDDGFTAAELRKRLRTHVQERHLRDLVRYGCLTVGVRPDTGSASYRIDSGWLLFPEFRSLFMKAQLLVEHDLVRRLQQAGRLQLLVLTGLFVGDRQSATDALLVGSINRQRAARLFRQFERDLNQEVKYTVMMPAEYRYRKDIGDRFIYDILEHRHLVVIDTLGRRPARQRQVKQRRRRRSRALRIRRLRRSR